MQTYDNIFHLSDIHIRLTERREEYEKVFNRTYKKINKLKNERSLIVLTGDIVHSKNKLTPQCIDITYEFIKNLSNICHVVLILGNHDTNLKNKEEIDSLKVIVRDIKNLSYLRESGFYKFENITFGVSSLLDEENIIQADKCEENEYKIALFHGAVNGAKNSVGHKLGGISRTKFKGYDLTLLGDIHQFQYLNKEKTMAYPSSLIQQNFGESVDNHGFIHWDLTNKSSIYHNIKNDYGFIKISDFNEIPKNISPYATIKMETNKDITKYVRKFKEKYPDTTIIIINKTLITDNDEKNDIEISNMDIHTQNNIIERYFSDTYSVDEIKEIQKLNIQYNKKIENNIEIFSKWKLINLKFSNMFSYGRNQEIIFDNMNGVIGIFGPNHYGKSSIFDIILYCLFEKTSKTDKHSRLCVINKSKKDMNCELNFKIGNDLYNIVRTGTIKKKFNVILKKNNVNINGDGNNNTNKIIESIIGTYNNFVSTCFSLQNNDNSFANLKQTDRKKYLYKMLRLDIYEDLYNIVHQDIKEKLSELKILKSNYDETDEIEYREKYQKNINECKIFKEDLEVLYTELIKLKKTIKSEKYKIKNIPLLDNDIDILTIDNKIEERDENIREKKMNIKKIVEMPSLDECKTKIYKYSKKNETYYKEIEKYDMNKAIEERLNNDKSISKKKSEVSKLSKTMAIIDKDVVLDVKVKIKEIKIFLEKNKHKKNIVVKIGLLKKSKYYEFNYEEEDYDEYKKNINIFENQKNEQKYLLKSITECENKIKLLENHEYNPKCVFCCKNNIVVDGDTSKNKLIDLKNEYDALQSKINTTNQYIINSKYHGFDLKDFRKIQKDTKIVADVLLYAENSKKLKELENKNRMYTKFEKQAEKINKLNSELEILDIKKRRIEDDIKRFEKSEKSNKKYNEKIKINNQKKEKYDFFVNTITTINLRNVELDKNITSLNNHISNIEKEIKNRKIYSKYSKHNKILQKRIQECEDTYNILNEEKSSLVYKIKDTEQNVDLYRRIMLKIENDRKKIDALKHEENILSKYSRIIKKDGVPLKILNETIPKIQKKINIILDNFVDFKLELVATEKNIMIYIVYDDAKWDVSGCSGFEKFIINIVFRIALQDITNISRPDFIAIDEGWGCFDENNLQKVDTIFNIVKSYYEYVLIITHIDKLKDNVDKHLFVKRDATNCSYIE